MFRTIVLLAQKNNRLSKRRFSADGSNVKICPYITLYNSEYPNVSPKFLATGLNPKNKHMQIPVIIALCRCVLIEVNGGNNELGDFNAFFIAMKQTIVYIYS